MLTTNVDMTRTKNVSKVQKLYTLQIGFLSLKIICLDFVGFIVPNYNCFIILILIIASNYINM